MFCKLRESRTSFGGRYLAVIWASSGYRPVWYLSHSITIGWLVGYSAFSPSLHILRKNHKVINASVVRMLPLSLIALSLASCGEIPFPLCIGCLCSRFPEFGKFQHPTPLALVPTATTSLLTPCHRVYIMSFGDFVTSEACFITGMWPAREV